MFQIFSHLRTHVLGPKHRSFLEARLALARGEGLQDGDELGVERQLYDLCRFQFGFQRLGQVRFRFFFLLFSSFDLEFKMS